MSNLEIEKIVNEMTLEEKALLLSGETFFRTRKLDKYGIPHMQLLDGGTGMNFEQLFGDWFGDFVWESEFTREELDNVSRYFFEEDKLTDSEKKLRVIIESEFKKRLNVEDIPAPGCYPPGIVLGSTWNRELVYKVGSALGMEANKYKIDCLLGTPNVNLLREPRNGRFFEGYSEDPYLAGQLGRELVKGVESRGVASDVKHFAANNLEINRIGIDQHISYRTLEEMYLPGFEACIKAGSASVMTSYPSINGKACTENSWLLRDVLRDRWQFKGINMTDWGACTGKTGNAVEAGMDLMMPGPWKHEDIIDAVNEGRLSREHLDEAVIRMLEFIDKYSHELNKYDDVPTDEYIKFGDDINYEAAAQGVVLLKNNGCLPLGENSELILCGNDELRIYGDGSAQVYTSRKATLSEVIPGLRMEDDEAFIHNENAVALVVCSMSSGEGKDRINLKMDTDTIDRLSKLTSLRDNGAKGKIVLVLNVSGPVELDEFADKIDGLISIYYPGGMGARVLADVLYGKVNPSGKVTCTWPVRYEDTPAYLCYPDGYHCNYGEGIFVGYRGFQKRNVKPLFSFGFGLSYSEFELYDVNIDKHQCYMNDDITVSYKVKNTSNMDGYQVVQLYISDKVSRVNKPVRELKGFNKHFIKAGEEVDGIIKINVKDLASYDDDLMKWIVEDGEYVISLGFDSESMLSSDIIRVMDGSSEYRLGINMTVDELQKYPLLRTALVESIKDANEDYMHLVMTERYVPARKIIDVFPNASEFNKFVNCCNSYLKD